jgi:hypothetical protein
MKKSISKERYPYKTFSNSSTNEGAASQIENGYKYQGGVEQMNMVFQEIVSD